VQGIPKGELFEGKYVQGKCPNHPDPKTDFLNRAPSAEATRLQRLFFSGVIKCKCDFFCWSIAINNTQNAENALAASGPLGPTGGSYHNMLE